MSKYRDLVNSGLFDEPSTFEGAVPLSHEERVDLIKGLSIKKDIGGKEFIVRISNKKDPGFSPSDLKPEDIEIIRNDNDVAARHLIDHLI